MVDQSQEPSPQEPQSQTPQTPQTARPHTRTAAPPAQQQAPRTSPAGPQHPGTAPQPPGPDRRDPTLSAQRDAYDRRFGQRPQTPQPPRPAQTRPQRPVNHDAERQRLNITVDMLQERLSLVRSRHRLQIIFYGNFLVLALIFLLGSGIHIHSTGDALTTGARFAALIGTYLLMVQLLLVGRLPWLDRLFGHDRLTRWHGFNGRISFSLIIAHAAGVIAGRAMNNHVSLWSMTMTAMNFRGMPAAVVGTALMALAIITSVRVAKSRIRFEHWHVVHAWTYIGIVMSFLHELNGPDFINRPLAQGYIWALYACTFSLVGFFRVVKPLRLSLKHQLRVRRVVEEGQNFTSVYMTGTRLDELDVRPGQFCYWRFLTKADRWEAHPYSISAAPNGKYLRITVKALGDASARVKNIPEGTRVWFEGPYGRFTGKARETTRAVLIAGGVGITPVRALSESIEAAPGDLTIIYRVITFDDAALLSEIEHVAKRRGAILHLVSGHHDDFPGDVKPLSADHIDSMINDVRSCDFYICAAPGLTDVVVRSLFALNVPRPQVHYEQFGH